MQAERCMRDDRVPRTGRTGWLPKAGLLLVLLAASASAEPYRVIYQFTAKEVGINPTRLVLGDENTLYGTAFNGGPTGKGTLFKLNCDGSGFSVVKAFTGRDGDGAGPRFVICSGRVLYGTTLLGGSLGYGTVFKVNTDGSGYKLLKSFSGEDGTAPRCPLLLGATLYGPTGGGGKYGYGTVYKINTDGSSFTLLKSFDGAEGGTPEGLTLSRDMRLYGTANSGGADAHGIVFGLNADGGAFKLLKGFQGPEGAGPHAEPVLSGKTLYGTAPFGGSGFPSHAGAGVLFKIEVDGSGFRVLKRFDAAEGSNPFASPVLAGDKLVGTCTQGGVSNQGVIFEINTDGSRFHLLREFSGSDGKTPNGLILSKERLYGSTTFGGISNYGVVFSLSLPSGRNSH